MHHGAHVEVRGQPAGIDSLLPPCGLQESNMAHGTWQQASLPAEPPHHQLDFSVFSCMIIISSGFQYKLQNLLVIKKTSVTLIWMTLDVHKSVKFMSTKVISKSCYLDGLLFCTGVCAGDFLRVAIFFVSFSIHWSALPLVWCACTRLSHQFKVQFSRYTSIN